MNTDPLSFSCVYIEKCYMKDNLPKNYAYATGFLIDIRGISYLLTNWHVVTNLYPEKPEETLNNYPPPLFLQCYFIKKSGKRTRIFIPLYDNSNQPLWFEHKDRNNVDMVIIPLWAVLKTEFVYTTINNFINTKIEIFPGRDVFIIGYPFETGKDINYYLPIWKKGTIATEPNCSINERFILVDALSKPGMSGSPVFVAKLGDFFNSITLTEEDLLNSTPQSAYESFASGKMNEFKETYQKLTFKFIGIYSGTIGLASQGDLALGKIWIMKVIEELINDPHKGILSSNGCEIDSSIFQQYIEKIYKPSVEVGIGKIKYIQNKD